MEKENKQMAPKPGDKEFNLDIINSCAENVVSGTECTGLVPTPPENEQEGEAYTDLYTIPKQSSGEKKSGVKKQPKN